MYVSKGIGAIHSRRGAVMIPIPRMIRRGFAGLGLDCPPGQTPTNRYDGTVACCGGPPESDPCSYLNTPQYRETQRQAQANAIAGDAGLFSSDLAAISNYPNNVQTDAIRCLQNPGQTFTDEMGIQVTCPSESVQNLSGGRTSIYSIPQLAAKLAGVATPSSSTPINQAPVLWSSSPTEGLRTAGPTQPVATSYPISVRLVNNSGGSNSTFNVGDSWTITVTGPPNSAVTAGATQNGTSLGTSPMGTIDSRGQLVITGTMAAAQVGSWVETWNVAGKQVGNIAFAVVAPAGSGDTSGGNGGSGGGILAGGGSGILSGSVPVGGTSIPTWALLAAGVGAVFLLGRGR